MEQSKQQDSNNVGSKSPFMSTPPTTRTIAFVSIAILVAFLLVLIVDSDNSSQKSKQKAITTSTSTSNSSTTTTTKKNQSQESKVTTTTKPIVGIKSPSEVSVLVLNGSSVSGVASKLSVSLQGLKYKVLPAGDSKVVQSGTTIYYKSGFQKDAEQLAVNVIPSLLNTLDIKQQVITKAFPSSAPVGWDQTNLVGANIVVVVGNAV